MRVQVHRMVRHMARQDNNTSTNMQGRVVQVSTSPGGVPKLPVMAGQLSTEGFAGDSWRNRKYHGGRDQAVLLISMEVLDDLCAMGFRVFPGALGENVTTEGIDYSKLRLGQRLRLGEAEIELTKVRVPCDTISVYGAGIQKEIYDAQVKRGDYRSPRWGHSGFYARVLRPGVVRPQDIIGVDPPSCEGTDTTEPTEASPDGRQL
jgi:MOSC domain-containing protein YiiM